MPQKKTTVMLFSAAIIALAIFMIIKPGSGPTLEVSQQENNIDGERPSQDGQSKTIGTEWQWQVQQMTDKSEPPPATNKVMASESSTNLPFDRQSVYNALQAVNIDEDGYLVLDHLALVSLDEALERIYTKLDAGKLEQLKDLIKDHLPGLAGEQTAEIVERYSQFLVAKDEFSRNAEQIDPDEVQSVATLERDELLYEELQDLREVYLGKEATDKLFAVSDANAELMFETLKIGADQSLTPEERGARLANAQAEHALKTIDIPNWLDRYDSFLTAKQNILDASISDSEKQNQLSSLLNDHFDAHEQAQIEHLALDIL